MINENIKYPWFISAHRIEIPHEKAKIDRKERRGPAWVWVCGGQFVASVGRSEKAMKQEDRSDYVEKAHHHGSTPEGESKPPPLLHLHFWSQVWACYQRWREENGEAFQEILDSYAAIFTPWDLNVFDHYLSSPLKLGKGRYVSTYWIWLR